MWKIENNSGDPVAPRIDSKDITCVFGQTIDLEVTSDLVQDGYTLHDLPAGYTLQSITKPTFDSSKMPSENNTTIFRITAPTTEVDWQEIFFGFANAKNYGGTLKIRTLETSPDFVKNLNSLSVARYRPGLVEINNEIYVIGGSGTNTMEVIDTSVTPYNVTTSAATLPFTSVCAAINIGNLVYVFTGNQVYKTSDITVANPVFTLVSGVNIIAMSVPAIVLVGTDIYVFGGPTGAIYVFDTTNDTISTHSQTLFAGFYPSASYNSTSNKIYVFGNDTLVRVLDLNTNTSSTLTAQSDGIIQGTFAIGDGNEILVTGGSGANTMQPVSTTQIFDMATETFSTAGSPLLDEALNFVAAIKLNDRVIAVGGLKATGLVGTIQYLELQ